MPGVRASLPRLPYEPKRLCCAVLSCNRWYVYLRWSHWWRRGADWRPSAKCTQTCRCTLPPLTSSQRYEGLLYAHQAKPITHFRDRCVAVEGARLTDKTYIHQTKNLTWDITHTRYTLIVRTFDTCARVNASVGTEMSATLIAKYQRSGGNLFWYTQYLVRILDQRTLTDGVVALVCALLPVRKLRARVPLFLFSSFKVHIVVVLCSFFWKRGSTCNAVLYRTVAAAPSYIL